MLENGLLRPIKGHYLLAKIQAQDV